MAGANVIPARPPPVFNKPLVFRDRKIQSFFAKVGAVVHSDILGCDHPEWIPVIGYNHRYIDYLQTFYRVTGSSCSDISNAFVAFSNRPVEPMPDQDNKTEDSKCEPSSLKSEPEPFQSFETDGNKHHDPKPINIQPNEITGNIDTVPLTQGASPAQPRSSYDESSDSSTDSSSCPSTISSSSSISSSRSKNKTLASGNTNATFNIAHDPFRPSQPLVLPLLQSRSIKKGPRSNPKSVPKTQESTAKSASKKRTAPHRPRPSIYDDPVEPPAKRTSRPLTMNGCSMASQGASIIPDRPLKWTKIHNTRSHAREPQPSDSTPMSTQPPTQSVEVVSHEISSGKDSASQGIVPNLVIPGESTPEPVVSEMVSPQLGPCKACDEQPCGHLRHFSVQLDEEDVEMLDATDEVNIAMNNCIQANRLYDTILMAEKPELAKKMAKKAVDIARDGAAFVSDFRNLVELNMNWMKNFPTLENAGDFDPVLVTIPAEDREEMEMRALVKPLSSYFWNITALIESLNLQTILVAGVTEEKAAKWMFDARCDALKNAQDAEREFNTVIERSFQ
ncbi:hypothetical protein CCHR01_03733 [Colletotrichum chrysophilum]|uniref:Uncharacterized protein n=2 Tax=Colletotrichum chrysophilum TaxID=1836956 RepID=A0AAD9ATS7_9PEZI|nr:hypothetical protein CCHR01_03733 [Colletotrichum chrysophilum]